MRTPLGRRTIWVLAATITTGCSALFWWLCERDPEVAFLSRRAPGEWIIYPASPDPNEHVAATNSAAFRRVFTLNSLPSSAEVSFRALTEATVAINGQKVAARPSRDPNWKQAQTGTVTGLLRVGTNEIRAEVTNGKGPPALWLCLRWPGSVMATDKQWESSAIEGYWKPARLASEVPKPEPGNPLYGLESMRSSLRRTWPKLMGMVVAAAAAGMFIRAWTTRARPAQGWKVRMINAPTLVVIAVAVGWVALFCNNLPQMPCLLGFDRNGHLFYIDYILHEKALPLADQGWQTYQPPLYYVFSSFLLTLLRFQPDSAGIAWREFCTRPEWHSNAALLSLRAFSGLIGLVHIVLIFICLRRLFPKQDGPQIVGTLLAAFLPAHLYLSHHPTNEGLAALFVTAALWFCLRIVLPEERAGKSGGDDRTTAAGPDNEIRPGILALLAVGTFLGLAMLTKFSVLLAVPPVLLAIGWHGMKPRNATAEGAFRKQWRTGAWKVSIIAVAMALTCGWHYVRVWQHFGKPLVGNWDPVLATQWWQEPGYRDGAWYLHFGTVFDVPAFSARFGFLDGVYSSLWGDGYYSGAITASFRPPWNCDFMNAGYLPGLIPTIFVITGLMLACIEFLRRPTPAGVLLLGLAATTAGGMILMSLRVPSYAQVKAFYGLGALLPFCAFGARGWQWFSRRKPVVHAIAATGISAWLIGVLLTFWINPREPNTLTMRGVNSARCGRYSEAAEYFARALQSDRTHLAARTGLADALAGMARPEEARREAEMTARMFPHEALPEIQLAAFLERAGKDEEAQAHLRQAAALAPDDPTTCGQLAFNLARLHRQDEAISIYKESLSRHPLDSESLNNLAWLLATSQEAGLRNGEGAIRYAEKACQLTGYNEPLFIGTLAAAYAEAARFDEAIAAGEKAYDRAVARNQTEVARKNRELLELYRAHKAYHEPAAKEETRSL